MAMNLKVLACQIDIPEMTTAEARDLHLQRTTALVAEKLKEASADLVVLPELSSIDYSRAAFENLHLLAEPESGPSFRAWQQIAMDHRCWVVYGFANCIDAVAKCYSISSAVIDPEGHLVAVYNKLHLAQFGDSMEKEYLTPGAQRLVVCDIKGFRFAPVICYDIRAPELCRTLAIDHKVDLILHTGAYARDPSFYSWHAFATTRAVENQVYFLSLNRAGDHFGHSVFCKPWIDENNPPQTFDQHAEQLQFFTLEKEVLALARTQYTFIKDRLESYQLPVLPS